ncbi:MAG: tRNA uridine(34) 5-carboxymethylaminomethyl modification radical SAM/GNAT enzyme Elp3 [Anaerolineaceae bacterium]
MYNNGMIDEKEAWRMKREHNPDQIALAKLVLSDLLAGEELRSALRKHPLPGGEGFLAKHTLVAAYRDMLEEGELEESPSLMAQIRMKPIRTLSGVTTITVLTKPAPCPGKCIFCPNEPDMPQSYLPDEPGARRGVENNFDPYRQVSSRLRALDEVGHPTDKIELLILGGSWDAYPKAYREWFVRRCFEALNDENSEDTINGITLQEVQARNVHGTHRNVGLVIETRPDLITPASLLELRRLGVTKLQIGVQSMDDEILKLNHRGHLVADVLVAVRLIRAGGFKLVVHWMPNLLGATPESDRIDFARLWEAKGVQPDELKIYPCQLLRTAELYRYWERGEYHPYNEQELIDLLADIKPSVPPYCRINRVIRDIPSQNVVEGNKTTSLRQNVAVEMTKRGTKCGCIRCREVRTSKIKVEDLTLNDSIYQAIGAEEHFISFDTPEAELAGFLRLSLPSQRNLLETPDLEGAAIIREVHVFGQSLEVGVEQSGAAQHVGLGRSLIEKAESIANQHGFERIAVISAVGTRAYYAARGFDEGNLYMVKQIS